MRQIDWLEEYQKNDEVPYVDQLPLAGMVVSDTQSGVSLGYVEETGEYVVYQKDESAETARYRSTDFDDVWETYLVLVQQGRMAT